MRGMHALLSACVLLGPLSCMLVLGADDPEKAAETFQALFGADLKRVKETADPRDDVDLAARLLDTARKTPDQPAFVALLCEKAYELGSGNPSGYLTAAAALELLAQTLPDRAAGCAERLLDLRQKQFDSSRGDEKKAAGEALLACLLPAAEAKENSGALPEAAALWRRTQTVAATIDSPRRAEIDARADTLAMRMKSSRQITDLKAMLERDPSNVGAREGLVRLYLVDLNDPAEAAKNLEGVKDAALLKFVPGAAKGVNAAPEMACLELGEWYRDVAAAAAPLAKAAMYARAKAYLKRFLEIHPAEDLDRTRATMDLARIEEAAGTLSAPVKPAPKSTAPRPMEAKAAEKWIDLLALVDPAKDALAGQWERQGDALAITGGKNDRRLAIPLCVKGSYELDARLTRTAGNHAVVICLPVGTASIVLCFSYGGSAASALTRVNGRGADANETTVKNASLENGRAYALHVRVLVQGENAHVEVTRDGSPFISWSGPQSALKADWTFADSKQPGLGSWGCKVVFHSLRLRMFSGEAKPLRP